MKKKLAMHCSCALDKLLNFLGQHRPFITKEWQLSPDFPRLFSNLYNDYGGNVIVKCACLLSKTSSGRSQPLTSMIV